MVSASGRYVGEEGQRTRESVVVVRAKDDILQLAPNLVCFFHPVPPRLIERAHFDESVWHVLVSNALYVAVAFNA
jgi:hypothetical protein